MNFIQGLSFNSFLIKYSKWPPKDTSFQNFKSQYLFYSMTDLDKICARVFALTSSLVLKVLLLNIAFSFKARIGRMTMAGTFKVVLHTETVLPTWALTPTLLSFDFIRVL